MTACLTEIETFVKSTWGPNIHFDFRASPDLPLLTCSRVRLQSAIMNLLFNARDAMPDGGAISVVAAGIDEGPGTTEIEVRVADNGLGMTRETMLRAVDPFFTTKSTGLGGLGLPMVMRFSHEAGGHLHIESEPGVGTTVTLRLPLSASEAEKQRQRRGAASSPGTSPFRLIRL